MTSAIKYIVQHNKLYQESIIKKNQRNSGAEEFVNEMKKAVESISCMADQMGKR